MNVARVLNFMKARGVRWPISRALASCGHGLSKAVVAELERRGLVRPGRVPAKHLPPPTNNARLDAIIRDLTELGVRWPVWRKELLGFIGVTEGVTRQLAQCGLIRGKELENPLLSPSLVWLLDELEIESKEEFRARMAEGEMELKKLRNVGPKNAERLMQWAYGNEAPPPKFGLKVRISQETKHGLEVLRVRRGLETDDELVEELVREAMGGSWTSRYPS